MSSRSPSGTRSSGRLGSAAGTEIDRHSPAYERATSDSGRGSATHAIFACPSRLTESGEASLRGEGASGVGPGPRGTINLPPCRLPIRCRSARPTRPRLPWSPSSPTPSTSRVVALPTGGATEWKVQFTSCQLQLSFLLRRLRRSCRAPILPAL